MHAAGLLSRIYAIEGASFLSSDSQGLCPAAAGAAYQLVAFRLRHAHAVLALARHIRHSLGAVEVHPVREGGFFPQPLAHGLRGPAGPLVPGGEDRVPVRIRRSCPGLRCLGGGPHAPDPFAFAVRTADLCFAGQGLAGEGRAGGLRAL